MTPVMTIAALRCEYQVNPIGINTATPRLSWQLRARRNGEEQSAYHILVSSSQERLRRDEGDLWDSGKVTSAQAIQLRYAGKALRAGQQVWWKVRAWDRDDRPTTWSPAATWEVGLLAPTDWSGALWIRDPRPAPKDPYADDPAPLFTRRFTLPRGVKRARLAITGLGYFDASINGQPVSDAVLEPGWTNYTRRVYYRTFDLTKQLQRGENTLAVLVGNGWWNTLPLKMFGGAVNLPQYAPLGRPRLIARLEIELSDGSHQVIVTDPSWQVSESALRFNNTYLGEFWDARREGESTARAAVAATEPVGPLEAEPQPPIRVIDRLKPVALTQPSKPAGAVIADFGVNFAGRVALTLRNTQPGQRIHLRYGELLHKDGTLNPMTSVCGQIKGGNQAAQGGSGTADDGRPHIPAVQEDTYICRGGAEEHYTPRFVFRGFRYLEVTGLAGATAAYEAHRLSADVESAGVFSCSDPLLNKIQEITLRTFHSNLFSVQSDCPHREKFGYGGDMVATRDAFLMNFDMAAFYAKVVQDYSDAARPDGTLPDTAPFVGLQYCGVGWAMAHPLLQAELLRYYGDTEVIEKHYAATVRWLEGVEKRYPQHLVSDGLTDHEGLTQNAPEATVTLLYAECARLAEQLARTLGRRGEAAHWKTLAQTVSTAYHKAYPAPPATQTSLAYALEYGQLSRTGQEAALKKLVADLAAHEGHLTTGIAGTKFLFDSLSRLGRADVAAEMAQKKTFPSWGWMLENGATTLWEHWAFSDNTFSHNHPMFGSISAWFYHWLAGIQPASDAIGFDRVALRPQLVPSLNEIDATYRSIRGPIRVHWKRQEGKVVLEVTLPVGCTGTLTLSDGTTRPITSGTHRLSVPG